MAGQDTVHQFKAIALAYDNVQDRILAVLNPGGLNSFAVWLTRRLVLNVLRRLEPALQATSPVVKAAPAEFRQELATFEREAALATTKGAMTKTEPTVLQSNARVADLAVTLSLSDQSPRIVLEVRTQRGTRAAGTLERAELQRVLQMLHQEAAKGAWLMGFEATPVEKTIPDAPAKRH